MKSNFKEVVQAMADEFFCGLSAKDESISVWDCRTISSTSRKTINKCEQAFVCEFLDRKLVVITSNYPGKAEEVQQTMPLLSHALSEYFNHEVYVPSISKPSEAIVIPSGDFIRATYTFKAGLKPAKIHILIHKDVKRMIEKKEFKELI